MIGVGSAGPLGLLAAETARDEPAPDGRPTRPRGSIPGGGAPDPLTEREAWAVLATVVGLGPVGFAALLRRHGTALEVLAVARGVDGGSALRDAAVVDDRPTLAPEVAAGIVAAAADPLAIRDRVRAADVDLLLIDDPDYPRRLRAIEMPPPLLFVRGARAALSAADAVAVVGTRRATEAGRRTAARIGGAIARSGGTVVSGLAMGIDGAAHAAAVAEGGPTVAVLGSGHARLFPRAHEGLARSIVAGGGAIVSELPPDYEPTRGTFPRRNRLISGLSDATVVVEAGARSGALITAGWALEQGRECFAVPGPIDAPASAGCLAWLREYPGQVRIVAGIPELLADLGLDGSPVGPTPPGRPGRPSLQAELVELGDTAGRIARVLADGGATLDALVAATGLPVATVLGGLTLLELRGLATTTYGRYRAAGRLASATGPGDHVAVRRRRPSLPVR